MCVAVTRTESTKKDKRKNKSRSEGIEPSTTRLRAVRSTDWARIASHFFYFSSFSFLLFYFVFKFLLFSFFSDCNVSVYSLLYSLLNCGYVFVPLKKFCYFFLTQASKCQMSNIKKTFDWFNLIWFWHFNYYIRSFTILSVYTQKLARQPTLFLIH